MGKPEGGGNLLQCLERYLNPALYIENAIKEVREKHKAGVTIREEVTYNNFLSRDHRVSITTTVQVTFGGQFVFLIHDQVLVADTHQQRINAFARRCLRIESETNAGYLRKSALQLGILGHTIF